MDQGPSNRSTNAAAKRSSRQGQGGRAASAGRNRGASEEGGMTGQIASQIGEATQHAGAEVKEAASSLVNMANEQVRRLADEQVNTGADFVLYIADAVRAAADSLDETIPQLSDLARGAAERIEDASETIREQSAGELLQTTAQFARRHPSIVFGTAAAFGFLAYRLLSAGSDRDYGDEDEFDDVDWDDFKEPAGTTGGAPLGGTSVRRGAAGTSVGGGPAGTSTGGGATGTSVGGGGVAGPSTGGGAAAGTSGGGAAAGTTASSGTGPGKTTGGQTDGS